MAREAWKSVYVQLSVSPNIQEVRNTGRASHKEPRFLTICPLLTRLLAESQAGWVIEAFILLQTLTFQKLVAEEGGSIWIWHTITIDSSKELSLGNTSLPLQKQLSFNRYSCPFFKKTGLRLCVISKMLMVMEGHCGISSMESWVHLRTLRRALITCCSTDIENGLEDTGRGKGKLGRSERVAWTYIHYQM